MATLKGMCLCEEKLKGGTKKQKAVRSGMDPKGVAVSVYGRNKAQRQEKKVDAVEVDDNKMTRQMMVLEDRCVRVGRGKEEGKKVNRFRGSGGTNGYVGSKRRPTGAMGNGQHRRTAACFSPLSNVISCL